MNRSRRKKKLQLQKDIKLRIENKLLQQVEKNVKRTNQRLKSIERKMKADVYASKNLKERLGSNYIKKGRIYIPRESNHTDLVAIKKATDIFLKSKTSTKKGINKIRENVKKGIKELFEDEYDEETISDETADNFYEFLKIDNFNFFADKIGASVLWVIINTAIINNDDLERFIDRLEDYIEIGNDEDMKERAKQLYNDLVK